MCYAFTMRMHLDNEVLAETVRPAAEAEKMTMPQGEGSDAQSSRKRSASTTLEHDPTKVAKSGNASERGREGSVSTTATVVKEESAREFKRKLQDLKDAANKKFKELKAAKKESDDKLAATEGEFAQLQIDYNNLKKSRGSGNSKELAVQITENLNKKHDKKISELKAKSQKTLDALKQKVQDAEEEVKAAKADFTQQEKEMKKENAELKKDLRAEQQAEIRKFKADYSTELKEKKEVIKTYEKKLAAHDKQNEQSGEEIGELKHEILKAEEFKRRAHARIRDQAEALKKKEDFTISIGQEYAAKTKSLEEKLAFEAKRWEKQRECCDEMKEKLLAQQKTNFILRNANESKIEKLEKVMAEMKRLRGLPAAGNNAAGEGRDEEGNVSAQKGDSALKEAEMSKTSAVIEEAEQEIKRHVPAVETPRADDELVKETSDMLHDSDGPTMSGEFRRDASARDRKADTPVAEWLFGSKPQAQAERLSTSDQQVGVHPTIPTEKVDSPFKHLATLHQGQEEAAASVAGNSEVTNVGGAAVARNSGVDPAIPSVGATIDNAKHDDAANPAPMEVDEGNTGN